MDFLQPVFDALNAGVDTLIEAAVPVFTLYALYLVARAKTALLQGVPAWIHAIVASGIERYLMPIVENAAKAAEESGARRVKDLLARGEVMLKQRLREEKVQYARQYVLDRLPDWLVSDERLGKMIDAALLNIGRGAAGAIRITVDKVATELDALPGPPAA